eukprot:TRINITY_DN6156_c0_g3_i2.p1 TRINITY_DN6156_c0_g3~~TRINITY_DN6156_c0_g3_i2.p1  ORF type:complete len:297 (+),score=127.09 TRINITY_DN6156_c0_g3_i2:136-1026(+)
MKPFQNRLQDAAVEPLTPRARAQSGAVGSTYNGDSEEQQQQQQAVLKSQLVKLLADAHLDEQSIWEGAADVFQHLGVFRDRLVRPDAAAAGGKHVVLFNFPPLPEFGGVQRKSYVINPLKPIHQVIRLLCQRQQQQAEGVAGSAAAARYGLATLRGYVMDDSEVLAAYGLGTLFANWELCVVLKPVTVAASAALAVGRSASHASLLPAPQPQSDSANLSLAAAAAGSVSGGASAGSVPASAGFVTFEFPELAELHGLRSKMLNIDLYTPLARIIESVCPKLRIYFADFPYLHYSID